MKLSIIVPVYNEEKTIIPVLDKLRTVNLPDGFSREIIVINDGSSDQTLPLLKAYSGQITLLDHSVNQGKGLSVIDGLKKSSGDMVVIQDADLEYDPEDLSKLLEPILAKKADVVFGSHFILKDQRLVTPFWHKLFNQSLTFLSNLFTNLTLTDMETCYKVFTREVVDDIKGKLRSPRFGIEPEITSKIKRYRIYEVPIKYRGRNVSSGKKITWRDGVAALWHIIRFNI